MQRSADAMAARPAAPSMAPAAGRPMIVLEPVSHPELAPIPIHDSLFAIGRTEAPFDGYPAALAADLSRRHARIFCEQGAVYFAELGSKNGSSVNGVPVRQAIAMLHGGDLLGLGKTLVFRVQLEPGVLQPPQSQPPHARLARLTLTPEHAEAGLQPIVVTEFPFMVGKTDDTFARYRETAPAQVNYLSRRHAHVFMRGGAPHVEDLGSTNGSFVNGVRLDERAAKLQEGDLLAFGGRHFVYRVALAWEAAPRDATVTRIDAMATPPAATDADRTTFVATADSFLDIFCVEAPGPDDAAAPAQEASPAPPPGRASSLLAGLHTALGGKAPPAARRLRLWGVAVLALLLALAWSLQRSGSAERQVENLLADGAWADASAAAGAALAQDPDNQQLRTLGAEALLKARLPGWLAATKAGQHARAARLVAAMRAEARHNPELAPLLDQLDWLAALEGFVAARGGASAPPRAGDDAEEVRRFLRQWDERSEAYQRGFATMAAQVPAFRDAYADALSDLRRLALAGSQ